MESTHTSTDEPCFEQRVLDSVTAFLNGHELIEKVEIDYHDQSQVLYIRLKNFPTRKLGHLLSKLGKSFLTFPVLITYRERILNKEDLPQEYLVKKPLECPCGRPPARMGVFRYLMLGRTPICLTCYTEEQGQLQ